MAAAHQPIYLLGGYQSDFARAWSRQGGDLSSATAEAVQGVLAAAQLDASAIETIHVGNAFGELQRAQGHLGAMPATVVPQLYGVPAMRHEAACASGSLAVLAAMAEIEAGRYECALVLGLEEERNLPGEVSSANMNCAGWVGHEQLPGRFVWPAAFGLLSDEYGERYGMRREHLAWIADNNFANARRNPLAQTRGWQFPEGAFGEDEALNPTVEKGMRRNHCAQLTDGACALVLASATFAREWAAARGLDFEKLPRISGWGHSTASLPLLPKFERAEPGGLMFPHVARTMQAALARAGLGGIREVDGIELHDCFAFSEYFLIEHLGLTKPGEGYKVLESGEIALGGRFPVNPSGGLIGGGHPVGATGTRMLFDAMKQVSGTAGAMQVEGAKRFATLNIGGSLGTVCSFVVAA